MKQNCINIKNSSFPRDSLTKSKKGLAILAHSPSSILTRLGTTWWPPGNHMRFTKLIDCDHLGIICRSHRGDHLRINYHQVVNSDAVNIYSYRHLVILGILTGGLAPKDLQSVVLIQVIQDADPDINSHNVIWWIYDDQLMPTYTPTIWPFWYTTALLWPKKYTR